MRPSRRAGLYREEAIFLCRGVARAVKLLLVGSDVTVPIVAWLKLDELRRRRDPASLRSGVGGRADAKEERWSERPRSNDWLRSERRLPPGAVGGSPRLPFAASVSIRHELIKPRFPLAKLPLRALLVRADRLEPNLESRGEDDQREPKRTPADASPRGLSIAALNRALRAFSTDRLVMCALVREQRVAKYAAKRFVRSLMSACSLRNGGVASSGGSVSSNGKSPSGARPMR
eukprot:CAMPEP_0202103396 /NCGR_PEP_ID=MMETSP0965-20130614/4867_1 /ASSEMBLY_ACC=CAM_ASM_000507 /TAXON_ID=4773 /ORGANISM="Schizochytrium aggregatum, Strain ATCC28209" /LENGTH=231 /DNA_ID=CAMNT_0048672195 /DNA_START=425 /DNA_END=1117 /DNA_ORIENTATION=+